MNLSELRPWPEDWPRHHNGVSEPCDMLVGPCSCGAWHQPGEFVLDDGRLVRFIRDLWIPSQ